MAVALWFGEKLADVALKLRRDRDVAQDETGRLLTTVGRVWMALESWAGSLENTPRDHEIPVVVDRLRARVAELKGAARVTRDQDDEQRRNRRLAERIASGGACAPLDDEMLATMRQMAGANLNPPVLRVVQLLAEYDGLRARVRELEVALTAERESRARWERRFYRLEGAGNALAEKAETDARVPTVHSAEAWRSAAGGDS